MLRCRCRVADPSRVRSAAVRACTASRRTVPSCRSRPSPPVVGVLAVVRLAETRDELAAPDALGRDRLAAELAKAGIALRLDLFLEHHSLTPRHVDSRPQFAELVRRHSAQPARARGPPFGPRADPVVRLAGVSVPDEVGAVQLLTRRRGARAPHATDRCPSGREELKSPRVSVAGLVVPGALVIVDADSFAKPPARSVPVARHRRSEGRDGEEESECDDEDDVASKQITDPSLRHQGS